MDDRPSGNGGRTVGLRLLQPAVATSSGLLHVFSFFSTAVTAVRRTTTPIALRKSLCRRFRLTFFTHLDLDLAQTKSMPTMPNLLFVIILSALLMNGVIAVDETVDVVVYKVEGGNVTVPNTYGKSAKRGRRLLERLGFRNRKKARKQRSRREMR
jgi:hypothetical protein